MSNKYRAAKQVGLVSLDELDWFMRVYLMQSDPYEKIEKKVLLDILSEKVTAIAEEYLSDEFEYIRSGFVLAHFGRRGVTFNLWHWANWAGTWEYFCQAWYCYGRDIYNMEPLDRSEPIFCQHEIDIVLQEALIFREISFLGKNNEEVAMMYRKKQLPQNSKGIIEQVWQDKKRQ